MADMMPSLIGKKGYFIKVDQQLAFLKNKHSSATILFQAFFAAGTHAVRTAGPAHRVVKVNIPNC
jgi:hypothetical protein